MSFRIHAAGSGGFRHSRSNCVDEGVFTAAAIMAAMQGFEPSRAGAVQAAADQVLPSAPNAFQFAAQAARIEMLNTLDIGVSSLATGTGAGGWIAVSPRQTHALWPDTSRFARYDFLPGDSPGFEFVQRILPALRETDMMNFGVLAQLSNACNLYAAYLDENGPATPMLLIELTSE
jgi:hypothetical protein